MRKGPLNTPRVFVSRLRRTPQIVDAFFARFGRSKTFFGRICRLRE